MTVQSNRSADDSGSAEAASPPLDLAQLARDEARLMRELASAMSDARATAGASLARTRELLEEPVSGSAMPHIQVYGGLAARLLMACERSLRTFGHERRQLTASASRQGSGRQS